jgi:hypothetical protein
MDYRRATLTAEIRSEKEVCDEATISSPASPSSQAETNSIVDSQEYRLIIDDRAMLSKMKEERSVITRMKADKANHYIINMKDVLSSWSDTHISYMGLEFDSAEKLYAWMLLGE